MKQQELKDLVKFILQENAPVTVPPPTKPSTPVRKPVPTPRPKTPNPMTPTRPNIRPRPKAISEYAPTTVPHPTRPTTPVRRPSPTPEPAKPNPMTPTRPNIRPRPKALSASVQAFINVRKGVSEAIDTTGYEGFFDPEKKSGIENERDYVENIFPDLGPNADRFLEIITSESYKKMIDKAAHYLGMTVEQLQQRFPNIPSLMRMFMGTAMEVEQIERQHKGQLEKMAVDTVLGMPEYTLFKKLIDDGQIVLDVKIELPNLTNAIADDELNTMTGNQLTVGENLEVQLAAGLTGDTESKLRRTLANFMSQGDAVNKFWAFNQVNDALAQINPQLPQKYGFLAAASSISYYQLPKQAHNRNFISQMAAGSEEVSPEGNGYKIKVRGRNFILLIHELVKGFNDYLTMDVGTQQDLDTETLGDELNQIMAGPAIDTRLRAFIPHNKIQYLPLLKKLIIRLPIPQIKELLMGGNRAQSIMAQLIKVAEKQWSDFENPEPEQPEGDEENWR